MLYLRQLSVSPFAAWGVRGWPSLLHPNPSRPLDGPIVMLGWALHEIPAAAGAGDFDAIDDLLAEAELWLDSIWRHPPTTREDNPGDLTAISALLWAELQRGRGALDLQQVTVHAHLLGRLFAATTTGQRPVHAVPAYVPITSRIDGGQLPMVRSDRIGSDAAALPERFLTSVLGVLSDRLGHLSDFAVLRCPPDIRPDQVGWTGRFGKAAGPLLGSIRREPGVDEQLMLRPHACVRALTEQTTVLQVGDALARRWLIDTTLELTADRVERTSTVMAAVLEDGPLEPVWRLPLSVFHPQQFDPELVPVREGAIPAQLSRPAAIHRRPSTLHHEDLPRAN